MFRKKDQGLLAEAYNNILEMNIGPAGEGIQPVGKPVIVTMDMPSMVNMPGDTCEDEDCEHVHDRDHDGEIEMALAELHKLTEYAPKLASMVGNMDSLEGWVAAKLTKAADYISSVYHWLEYKSHESEGCNGSMFNAGYEDSATCEYAVAGCKCGNCSDCR